MARAFQKVGLGERPPLRILLQYVFLPVPCGLSSPHALASVGPASASSSGRSVALTCLCSIFPYPHTPRSLSSDPGELFLGLGHSVWLPTRLVSRLFHGPM